MTGAQFGEVASALLAVATPWLVASIVHLVARAHAKSVGLDLARPRSFSTLTRVTLLTAVPAAVAAALLGGPSPWMFLVGGLGFVIPSFMGWRVLADIDRASLPARELSAASRTASLTPRHARHFLPWTWRAVNYAVAMAGIAALAVRALSPLPHRQLLVPMVFAFAATMFMLLYETWIQQVVTGPAVSADAAARWRLVRRVFAAEVVLVLTSLGVAHALLDLNWTTHGTLAATLCIIGGGLGIAGCAMALASGLTGRRYQTAK